MCHLGHRAVPRNEQSLSTVNDHRSPRRRGRRWCSVSRHGLDQAIGRGVDQYVIVAAGLDTFALRRPELLKSVSGFFELDQPATQAGKRRRFAELEAAVPPGFTSCRPTSRRRAQRRARARFIRSEGPGTLQLARRRLLSGARRPAPDHASPALEPGSSDPTSLRTGTDFTDEGPLGCARATTTASSSDAVLRTFALRCRPEDAFGGARDIARASREVVEAAWRRTSRAQPKTPRRTRPSARSGKGNWPWRLQKRKPPENRGLSLLDGAGKGI